MKREAIARHVALFVVLPIVVIALVIITSSCRQVVGIDDVTPPPRCVVPTAAPPSCADCLIERCCTELDTCNADPACTTTFECTLACSDENCRADCEKKKGLPESSAALSACRAHRCDTACGLPCGGFGSPITGCKPCASSCCAEGATFSSNLDGQRLRTCRSRCKPTDATCLEACVNAHPEGADRERAALQCVATACGFAGDWSCVGHVETPTTKANLLVLDLTAYDFQTLAPIPQLLMRGCSINSLACEEPAPFGSATTNAGGFGRLNITLNPEVGFDAYAGFIEVSHPDYLTGLLFFTPPIVTSTRIGLLNLSRKSLKEVEQTGGTPIDPNRGFIGFSMTDCGGRPARGVSIRIKGDKADARTRTFYTRNASAGGSTYDFAATSTNVGTGGIINVLPGNVELSISVDGLCVEAGHTTVGVRAGAVTLLLIPPLPAPP